MHPQNVLLSSTTLHSRLSRCRVCPLLNWSRAACSRRDRPSSLIRQSAVDLEYRRTCAVYSNVANSWL